MEQTSETDEYLSSVDFNATIERLIATVEAADMSVFARIDHAAAAAAVGLALPPPRF